MFSLVSFSDHSYIIYQTKKIIYIADDGSCIVNHNGCKYEGLLITRDDSKDILRKLQVSYQTTGEPPLRESNESQNRFSGNSLRISESFSNIIKGSSDRSKYSLSGFVENDSTTGEEEEVNSFHDEKEFSDLSNSDEDPNYVPNEAGDGDDEDEDEDENQNIINKNILSSSLRYSANSSKNDRSSLGLDLSFSANNPGTSSCNVENMYVTESEGRNGDKKFNFCLYCNKKQKKIARHFELKHRTEDEVKKILILPKGSQERRILIGNLRKRGNFTFNTSPQFNDGELIVSRRPNPSKNRKPKDYMPCGKCKAYFSKLSLRAHFVKCTGISSLKNRMVLVTSRKIVGRIHLKASDIVRQKLFPVFIDDDVVSAIRYDQLIIIYANKMCEKYKERRHFEMIRQRIRLLGRFLLKIRELENEITDFTSIYDPKYIDSTIKAISLMAQFDHTKNCFRTPSVAFSLGSLLKQIGNILINESIKNHDECQKKNSEYFLQLLVQEVNISVNRTVVESQVQHRRRKVVQLPLMEDIKKLYDYLSQKRNHALTSLKKQFSNDLWLELTSATLISTQLFNRRRAGEVERILIEDFKVYQGLDESDKELFNSLSEEGKKMARRYVRFAIRGKLNRTVPVLLNDNLLKCINVIIEYREQANVKKHNPYVFGIGGSKYLRACLLLRQYSTECGAQHPERLRGTQLRKHIATKCLSLNLSENEYDELADFMGHAKKIHRDIYRQSQSSEILKMSKLLEIAQGVESSDEGDSSFEENAMSCEPSRKQITSSGKQAKRKRSTSPYGHVQRRRWGSKEKQSVLGIFENFLKIEKLPSIKTTQEAISCHAELQSRTVPQIRTWLHNQIKKTKNDM